MEMIKNRARIEMSSMSENIGFARIAAATFAAQLNFTLAEIEEIKVAVSEAVSNCIIHGYENRPDGTIVLNMTIEDGKLKIEVEDFGVGIEDIEAAMQPSFTTSEERMGLGLVFINSFMNEMEIISTPGEGTLVRMVKIPEKSE
ncbi:anti-sigma F factor [Anoxybacter fermentans]|uniref:Anti-sigma F factor n=2 Tax=Anoxybacter fermentans TaxID=1323375 RepID=A0A3Q9HSQ6_9FIRM|nr:anti-sigma F factor [Anoxybacter fermentans]